MQLMVQIGEATPTFSITIFTNAIEESDRGSNSYFFELLYIQMQLRNQIGEASPTFSNNYIHKCNLGIR